MNNRIFLLLLLCLSTCLAGVSQTAVWDTLPIGLNWTPKFMYEDTVTDQLFIGGGFWKVNGDSVNYLIAYDGENWHEPALDSQGNPILIPQTPEMMTRFGSELILAGWGGIISNQQNSWTWLDFNNAVIWAAMPYQGKMVFGGRFSSIGLSQDSLDAVAVWDGQQWADLYGVNQVLGGENNAVTDIVEYQGEIYIGGNFTEPGGLNEITRWDGQQWRDVGGGVPNSGLGGINDMIVYRGDLYVGGIFTKANGAPGNNIARWNGQQWDDIGGGVGVKNEGANSVEEMMVYNDELWVTGSFLFAGGIPAQFMAKWDGSRWYSLGEEFLYTNVLGTFRDTLYSTTGVLLPDGTARYHLVKLLQPEYYDTASAAVVNTSIRPTVEEPELRLFIDSQTESLLVELSDVPAKTNRISIQVIDLAGRVVLKEEVPAANGSLSHQLEIRSLSEGNYFVELRSDSWRVVKQFVR